MAFRSRRGSSPNSTPSFARGDEPAGPKLSGISSVGNSLSKKEWLAGGKVAGAVTLIYDHHRKNLLGRITDIQHEYHHLILSAQHIHLDHDHCPEIIAVKGNPAEVHRPADALKAIPGVKHGTLSMSTTGRDLE